MEGDGGGRKGHQLAQCIISPTSAAAHNSYSGFGIGGFLVDRVILLNADADADAISDGDDNDGQLAQ